LKADIVEALQVLKCMILRDLIFRKSALVEDTECDEDGDEMGKEGGGEAEVWDALLDDDPIITTRTTIRTINYILCTKPSQVSLTA
jgi:hypothetical protein